MSPEINSLEVVYQDPPQKQIIVVDSQILNMIQECARKTHYTFSLNLEPIVKPDYFEKGDFLHQMLAQYYKLRMHRSNWQVNKKTHADIVDACLKVGQHFSKDMSLNSGEKDEVTRTFREYCTHTANDGWDNILFVEKVASKILYEDEFRIILYQGKLDLGISLPTCPVLPIDHKSASRRGKPNFLSNQFQGYCWLLGVNNIIINKIGFQKTLSPAEKFERPLMSYSSELIEEWRENAIYWILKYLDDSSSNFYPPNYTSCDKYSGCVFQDVCRQLKDSRQYKLIQLFKEKDEVWDVGKSKEIK